MKNDKGITLASLIIYILAFTFILGLLTSMTSYIYGNLDKVNSGSYSSEEFNKFNINFIKDIKSNMASKVFTNGNDVKIVFENDVNYTYVFNEKAIYRNKVKIAEKILSFQAENTTINNKKVIKITIATGKDENEYEYGKTINYVYKYWKF